ncbi:MAG: translation initiation factor IF-2 N-terminal domain-containing protein, partial [Lachnospiraceae bacterium]|nr:translation initiation factor IF-2 N-terminal domain-containing protein [Lachnospiraceae bacterium]
MAKTKISELAEQLGADRKDIVSFLNEKGIAAKTGNSSIEDDAVAMVAGHFKENKAANTKTEKAVTVDKTPEEKTIVKKPVRIETVKPETAATAPDAHETSAAAANSASAAGVIPVKKKKKIIIVTGGNAGGQNRQQSQTNVRQPGQSQGQRSNVAASRQSEKRQNGNTFTGRPVHKIIKPKTVPSQMEVDYHKPMQPSQMAKQVNRQEKPEPVVEEPKKTVAATQVTEKVSVPSESTVKPAENKSVGKAPEAAPVKTAQENATVNIGSEKTEKKETVEKPAAKTENTGNRSAAGNGQSSHGVYISRGGQSGQGGYNGNRGGQGSYNNNRSGQGSYGNRGGQGGQNSQGSYGNRGGQGGQNSQGSYGNRGGYSGGQGGQNSQGSYGNRGGYSGGQGGQNSQGGYGKRGGYSGG